MSRDAIEVRGRYAKHVLYQNLLPVCPSDQKRTFALRTHRYPALALVRCPLREQSLAQAKVRMMQLKAILVVSSSRPRDPRRADCRDYRAEPALCRQ